MPVLAECAAVQQETLLPFRHPPGALLMRMEATTDGKRHMKEGTGPHACFDILLGSILLRWRLAGLARWMVTLVLLCLLSAG